MLGKATSRVVATRKEGREKDEKAKIINLTNKITITS